MTDSTIIYTHTDEAPALATYSFLPVVQAYASQAGVAVETRDISLAGRIVAVFPEYLTEDQRPRDRAGWTAQALASPAAQALARCRLPESDAIVLAAKEPPAWTFLHGLKLSQSSTAIRKTVSSGREG